jgi:hypothetical protein
MIYGRQNELLIFMMLRGSNSKWPDPHPQRVDAVQALQRNNRGQTSIITFDIKGHRALFAVQVDVLQNHGGGQAPGRRGRAGRVALGARNLQRFAINNRGLSPIIPNA